MEFSGCTLFSADDAPLYNRFFAVSRTEISDACLNSRVAWNSAFAYHKAVIDDTLCLISDGSDFTTPHMTWPVGNMDEATLQRIVDTLHPVFRERDWKLRMMYIDEMNLPMVQALQGYRVKIGCNRDFSDYLYEAKPMRDLSGKTMKNKRSHFNQFCRAFPDFEYQPIRAEDRDEALGLVKAWCDEKGLDCLDLTASDYKAVRQIFVDFDKLEVHGGVVRIDGKLVAFTLGSLMRDDTAIIHFEKADARFPGLYAAINKLTMDHTFPQVTWVNREEDMGIRGLRRAKKSYGPIRMIKKCEATICKI